MTVVLVAVGSGANAQSEVFPEQPPLEGTKYEPYCLTGMIERLPQPDEECDDGATHRLRYDRAEPMRLKGKTRRIVRQLDVLVGMFPVTVCGWYVQGPECEHLLVGTIVKPDEFVAACGAALEAVPPKSGGPPATRGDDGTTP